MVFLAATLKDDHFCRPTFSRWKLAINIRNFLQKLPLQDHSLVDDLIASIGDSISNAAFACALLCFVPPHTAHTHLQILLGHHTQLPPNAVDQSTFDIFTTFGIEPSTQIKGEPRLNAIRLLLNPYEVHRFFALSCLRIMSTMLRFNMCSIPSSYTSSNDAQGDQLIQDAQRNGSITPSLLYACVHWAYHASFVPADDELIDAIISVLERHALHWLEVLSLVGQYWPAIPFQLRKLQVRCHSFFPSRYYH